GFVTAELADKEKETDLKVQHPILNNLNIVTSSDAHYLENMKDAQNFLELSELSSEKVIEYLDSKH
ncbi:MAG: phosphoesterase, partial [Ruminococcus sp.]|nr:phosphoesterase [Ruminococcus sp.]